MLRVECEEKETSEYVRVEVIAHVLRRYKYVPRRKKKDANGERSDEEYYPGNIIVAQSLEVPIPNPAWLRPVSSLSARR